MKKIIALLLAAIAVFGAVTACNSDKKENKTEEMPETSETTAVTTAEPTTSIPVETYPESPISFPKIEQTESGILCEAENCELEEGMTIGYEAAEFSGNGYVTGFGSDGKKSLTFCADIPSNQHYDLSFSIASEKAVNCQVMLGDEVIKEFQTKESGEFTFITIYGIFLEKGEKNLVLRPENGEISVDYLKITNSSALEKPDVSANGETVNANASESAKDIMAFLSENYGKYVLTGQYVSDESNSEIELIYRTTGKYPVIRFSDMSAEDDGINADIEAIVDWYKNGGLPFVSWFWEAPSDKKSGVLSEDTDFSLAKAVTDKNISELSQDEIRKLYDNGEISEECFRLVIDIDNMSAKLAKLQERGVPLLFRPLPEGCGDWYWWGADGAEAYKWLWKLIYERMTNYFELSSLIWVWNGQSESTLVDKNTFDIAAVDLYINGEKDYGNKFYESFAAVRKFIGNDRLLGLSECGSVPDMDSAFRDNAVWSFFGLWNGKYVENGKGGYSEEFTSKNALIKAYNSEGSLTLDEYQEKK